MKFLIQIIKLDILSQDICCPLYIFHTLLVVFLVIIISDPGYFNYKSQKLIIIIAKWLNSLWFSQSKEFFFLNGSELSAVHIRIGTLKIPGN